MINFLSSWGLLYIYIKNDDFSIANQVFWSTCHPNPSIPLIPSPEGFRTQIGMCHLDHRGTCQRQKRTWLGSGKVGEETGKVLVSLS